MLLIWASLTLLAVCHAQEPALVGSEVKILDQSTSAPPAPVFSESSEPPTPPAQLPNEPADPFAEAKISNNTEGGLKPEEPLAKVANASLKEADLANQSSPIEFEPNVTLSNEQKEKEKENVTVPINQPKKFGQKPEEGFPSNRSLPLKPLGNNETAVDLGALGAIPKGKNDSELISELLSNTTGAEANLNSSSRFLLPSRIEKVRLTIIGFTGKPVHTFNLSENQVLYQMKVFWGEPESWQDIGYQPTDRLYEVFCWLTVHGGFSRDLFRGNLSASLDQHSQWYAFPEAEDNGKTNISVNCGMRAVNAAGKGGDWSFADPAPVREAPVFLRGFENVNVRGWTKEEVVRLIRNQKRHDSVQPNNKAAQAKAKSKNRRAS